MSEWRAPRRFPSMSCNEVSHARAASFQWIPCTYVEPLFGISQDQVRPSAQRCVRVGIILIIVIQWPRVAPRLALERLLLLLLLLLLAFNNLCKMNKALLPVLFFLPEDFARFVPVRRSVEARPLYVFQVIAVYRAH